jgi:cytochrome c-type biogenesis protein
MMAPTREALSEKYDGKVNVVYVHVGNEQILASRFGVQGIPLLILVGMLLLGLLNVSGSFNIAGAGLQERVAKHEGTWWSLPIGILFALSFCPVSAGLYFGGLIPLSTTSGSLFILPVIYGLGTALPVIFFAFLLAFASKHVGKAFNRLTQVERWVRLITGLVFILAGFYYSLTYVYGLSLLPK